MLLRDRSRRCLNGGVVRELASHGVITPPSSPGSYGFLASIMAVRRRPGPPGPIRPEGQPAMTGQLRLDVNQEVRRAFPRGRHRSACRGEQPRILCSQ